METPAMTRAKPMPSAFTLIEILVVIAIVSILAAMLAPAIAAAKNRGRMTGCVNNLHQLALALQMYSNDFENRVPRSAQDITDPNAGPYPGARWTIHLQWRRFLPANNPAQYWQFPALARNSILICPSDQPSQWATPNDAPLMQEYGGSYLYNAETIAVDGYIPRNDMARKILVIDGPPKDGSGLEYAFDQGNYAARMKTSTFPTGSRHFGKSNALFLDWHVEAVDPALVTVEQVQLN